MKAYRASLLWFAPHSEAPARALFEQDGLLVIGPDAQGTQVVQAIGAWSAVAPRYPQVPVEHLAGRIIAPGFVDLHVHFPQTNVIGSPADGLLPWLENYTFPEEKRFQAPEYSAQAATFFIAELLRNGVTTALAFATSHTESVNALFAAAQAERMRMVTGLCLMDRNAPAELRGAVSWRPNTRMCGSKAMWPKTRRKLPGPAGYGFAAGTVMVFALIGGCSKRFL